MQERHLDRFAYFRDSAITSKHFYVPYLETFIPLKSGMNVLEIGCGEGGNLLPFAELGCHVTGIDRVAGRIRQAQTYFSESHYPATFMDADFLDVSPDRFPHKFSVILVHDVIEHVEVERKLDFILHAKEFLAPGGLIFWGFPAWQMPFGGHQQICRSRIASKLPYIHLLPKAIYKAILKLCGEDAPCIHELMNIHSTQVSLELFEKLMRNSHSTIVNRHLWLVNPHYLQKFHLKPHTLPLFLNVYYLRNFFCTSCWFLTR